MGQDRECEMVLPSHREQIFLMIGSELFSHSEYLLSRASEDLGIKPTLGPLARRFAPPYISIFGVPEIGVQMRIIHALGEIPPTACNILDAGCGAGMLLGALHRRWPQAHLTGIELDERSSDVARQSHPYANIVHGDVVSAAPQFAAAFDVAICIDVLEHIPETSLHPFVTAIRDMLRPSGTAIFHVPATSQRRHLKSFAEWGHHDHEREGFSRSDISQVTFRAGLAVESVAGTFGFGASLAWELNMLLAASPLQAIAFPPLLLGACISERLPRSRPNGWLVVAARPH